jgi:hypothetical protein
LTGRRANFAATGNPNGNGALNWPEFVDGATKTTMQLGDDPGPVDPATQKAVTQAEAQLGQARQQHEQARQNLPKQVAMQRETLAERKAAERKAAELAAKAQADQAELNLEYTRTTRPRTVSSATSMCRQAHRFHPGRSCSP